MKSTTHTIGTTASRIVTANNSPQHVYIHVTNNGTVYLGDSTVTSSTGMGTEKSAVPCEIFVPPGNELWAVVATGTQDLRILQEDGAS